MGKGLYHPEQCVCICVSVCEGEGKYNTHTHSIMLASRARSRVKNGTCQERRRQERGAITRDSERGRRSGEMIERFGIHEGSPIGMREGGGEQ